MTKNRMTFVAFRQNKDAPPDVMPLVPELKIKEPEEERVKRIIKRFAFSSEEEVRRVMGYYKTALERYRDPEDAEDDEAELLPVQGLKNWLCQFSGIDENQPLGPRRPVSLKMIFWNGIIAINGVKKSWFQIRWSGGSGISARRKAITLVMWSG